MKLKLTIVIVSIFLLHLACYGQIPHDWGILGGITSSNLTYEDKQSERSRSFDTKNGYRIGVFGEFLNNSYFNIFGDLSYVQRGTQDDEIIVSRVADTDLGFENIGTLNQRLDYISLTILGKGKYKIGMIVPYLCVGPSVSYLVGGNDQVEPWIDKYNRFVFGVTVGIGTEIDTNLPISFILELRYYQDLTFSYENDHITYKNHSFEYIIGIKL